jgi:hypothetical protein
MWQIDSPGERTNIRYRAIDNHKKEVDIFTLFCYSKMAITHGSGSSDMFHKVGNVCGQDDLMRIRKGRKMRKQICCRWIAIFACAMLLERPASGTILTFEVEKDNAYSNNTTIGDSYGSRVTDGDSQKGNYLEGNGWTPDVSVAYTTDHATGFLTADGGLIPLLNGGFNENVPAWTGPPATDIDPIPLWTEIFNAGSGGFLRSTNEAVPGGSISYPGANEGTGYATFFGNHSIHQSTPHNLTVDEQYILSVDLTHDDGFNEPGDGFFLRISAGPAENTSIPLAERQIDYAELVEAQWINFSVSFDATAENIAAAGATGQIGQPLWIRLIATPFPTGTPFIHADDVQFTVEASDTWDQVAVLPDPVPVAGDPNNPFTDPNQSFISFIPGRGFAVDVNGFDLDPSRDLAENQTGFWRLYQDSPTGAVIDSGVWDIADATNQSVAIDMSSVGGSYNGTVVLQVASTGGTDGNMAIDKLDFDQVKLNCDEGYVSAVDLVEDCQIDILDLHAFAADFLTCNDPQGSGCN